MKNYTVNISLPKPLADMAREQVKKGYYASVSEVIREALRDLFAPEIPTFKLSRKTVQKIDKAHKDHLAGKTILLNDVNHLDKL